MSPAWTRSGFVGEKRRVRAPEGSRVEIWMVVRWAIGSGQCFVALRGGGTTGIFFRPTSNPARLLVGMMCEVAGVCTVLFYSLRWSETWCRWRVLGL